MSESGVVRPGEGDPRPGDVVPATVVRKLPPGSAVVISSVDGQPIDEPYTARIVTKHGNLIAPPGINEQYMTPIAGEMYRVLWVQGAEEDI